MKIGLVYDLRSEYLTEGYSAEDVAEFDSESTIAALADAIRACGHEVDPVGRGRALAARLVGGDRWDLVFSIAEGMEGRSREAQVPALLDLYGVPCAMSDALVCAVTLDKAVAKRIVLACGLPTPRFCLVSRPADLDAVSLDYPLFVKPVAEGTGKGIDHQSRVAGPQDLRRTALPLLRRLRQPVLVEEYLPGREFTTGVLGTGPDARVLGTMEISMLPNASSADYSFDVKEKCETVVRYAALERGALRADVEDLALKAYRALECRDAGRVDIRLDRRGKPAFMEMNALPGLHPTHSDLPMIATQEGMPYVQLIGAIIDSAAQRLTPAAATRAGA
ncbi:MAG: D-alanine--D-alanine ligase [Lentisphaerae bacterium]|nr:D-alanine--D-alanine ligase [Lentisphaerota bacterium]